MSVIKLTKNESSNEQAPSGDGLRVCMVAYTFYESDTRVLQYATALRKRGDTVDIFALRRDPGQPEFEVIDGVKVFRIQSRTVNETNLLTYARRIFRFSLLSTWRLYQRHRERRYDLIHVHNVPDFLVFTAFPLKLSKIPVILDIHDLLPEFYASKFKISNKSLLFKVLTFVERCSCAFADHVIIANHLWQDRLVTRSTDLNKCSVVRNYPDLDIFCTQLSRRPKDSNSFLLVYPGSLNFHQGLDVAIRAFARIADQIPEASFHIYGEGSAKYSLIQLTNQLGIQNRVIFHGLLSSSEIARVMAQADLAIEPKRATSSFGNEALSTKILEFMTLGVPIIASKTRIHAIYYDDSIIRYYENDDETKLAECIVEMQQNPELRAGYAQRAVIFAEKNTWQARQGEYIFLIDSLTGTHFGVSNNSRKQPPELADSTNL